MKQKIIVAICILALVAGTVCAVRLSDQYQAKTADKAARAAIARQEATAQAQAQEETEQRKQGVSDKRLEGCKAGQRAYDELTTIQRATLAKIGVNRAVCQ